jgi:hypothetical protein
MCCISYHQYREIKAKISDQFPRVRWQAGLNYPSTIGSSVSINIAVSSGTADARRVIVFTGKPRFPNT